MTDYNITGGNLPKDSGNRFYQGLYDPASNGFVIMWANPVSGSAGGLAMGHLTNHIVDVMTSTGALSSGVDLGGYPNRGLIVPPMGSGCWFLMQVSGSGLPWATLASQTNGILSATGLLKTAYAMDNNFMQHLDPYRYVRISATVLQTAERDFTWALST